MKSTSDLNVFLNPRSVAVIGASERPGSWGSFIMEGLLSGEYPGMIYPVNKQAERIFNVPSFRDVNQIKVPVDLAVVAIPEKYLEETIKVCGQKKVKGITVITAGFAETSNKGGQSQERLTRMARSLNMRMLGPNVSGTFNLHKGFCASSAHAKNPIKTPIAALCQGGGRHSRSPCLSVTPENGDREVYPHRKRGGSDCDRFYGIFRKRP